MSISPAAFQVIKTIHTVGGIKGLGDRASTLAADIINLNAENNFWKAGTATEGTIGADKYRIFAVKFLGPGTIRAASLRLQQAPRNQGQTDFKWAFDPLQYRWGPFGDFNGTSDKVDQADSAALDLTKFTVVSSFKTSKTYTVEGAIVNKGGFGSETAGQNMSYGMYITSSQTLAFDFETTAGVNHPLSFPLSVVNDDKWHTAIARYDKITLKFCLDFDIENEESTATTDIPETNALPLRIGANSRGLDRYFEGNIDEVLIYNRAWTDDEVMHYGNTGHFSSNGLVYENHFGGSNQPVAQDLIDENHAPAGSPSWNLESATVPVPANVGDMVPGQLFMVVGWWSNIAGTLDIENSFVELDLSYKLESGQTVPPPPPTGGCPIGQHLEGGVCVPNDPDPDPDTNPPPTNNPLTLTIVGDWGVENETDDCVDRIVAINPNKHIDTGDKSYTSSISGWKTKMSRILSKIIDTMGNHEDDGSGIRADCFSTFATGKHFYQGTQKSYYYVIVENAAVIVMDSEISFSKTSAQGTAILSFLTELDQNSNIDWRYISFHRPWAGPSSDHPNNEGSVIQTWMATFVQRKIDFICTGHNHNMFVSFPVEYNSSSPTSPTVMDSSQGPYTAGGKLMLIGSGTGGHDSGSSLYSQGSQPSYIRYQNDSDNGVHRHVFSNNNKTITGSFVSNSGNVLNTYVINKITSPGPINPPPSNVDDCFYG